jgi:glycosyltransferase involved in cell wall biosynthesis
MGTASDLNLQNVVFHGRYEPGDLKRILAGCDVTVHPSVWAENSPFTVRESLQHGVPAVVSDIGGLSEMISTDSGSVAEPSNPVDLANKLLYELRERRADGSALRTAVRERAVSDDRHLEGLVRMYDLAQQHHKAAKNDRD